MFLCPVCSLQGQSVPSTCTVNPQVLRVGAWAPVNILIAPTPAVLTHAWHSCGTHTPAWPLALPAIACLTIVFRLEVLAPGSEAVMNIHVHVFV